jgi:hypothetical protein
MATTMRLRPGLLLSLLLVPLGCRSGDDGGFPPETATCDEMVRFLVGYAEGHGACATDTDCVPGIGVVGTSCAAGWIRLDTSSTGSREIPALRADAAGEAFAAFRERLAGCCSISSCWAGGDGWVCECAWDYPYTWARAACSAGRCVGRVESDPRSCLVVDGGDTDADAGDDADAARDEAAGEETGEGAGDVTHECESDSDCVSAGPCMRMACDPATHRCCSRALPEETPCDDGVHCNGTERCVAGVCTPYPGTAPCDRDPCRLSTCDEATATCSAAVPAPVGTPCRFGPADCITATCDGTGSCADTSETVCPRECCTDQRDNDGDLAVDCEDPDCLDDPACTPCRPGPEICWDGCDNDVDGRTDGFDDDCTCFAPCLSCACRPGPEICDNNCDDDRDRLPDCVDPECAADPHCTGCVPDAAEEDTAALCRDFSDNDCDGFTDCCDFPGECHRLLAECDIPYPENCRNGRDDDYDALPDCADLFDCGATPWCACAVWAPEDCDNGIDDDRDGLTDLDDPDCPRECG